MSEAIEKSTPKNTKGSAKAKRLSARLCAVQAWYQHSQNKKQSVPALIAEVLEHNIGMEIEGEQMLVPDGTLLTSILTGMGEREADLRAIVAACVKKNPDDDAPKREIEPLLMSILLAGAYELLCHHDIDAPIIINDYLNVTHGFYEKGEVGLINGVLDRISSQLRPSS